MVKALVLVLLLVATGSVAPYPRYEEVVRSPKEFDLLYSSTSGPVNETWYFGAAVQLTSIIVPSQVFNFWSTGAWTSGTYKEAVDVFVYETKLANPASKMETYLVATGSFNGTVNFGQELDIPLWNTTLESPPPVQRYVSSYTGCKYTVTIVFKTTGFYPWYTKRALSTYSSVHTGTDVAGIAIGLSYSN